MKILLATLASAVLYALLFPPFGCVWLSWIALTPLLLALRGRSAREAAALAGCFAFTTTALVIAWIVPTLNGHFDRSLAWSVGFVALLSTAAMAPFSAAAFALHARASQRVPSALVPLLVAAAWVASEYARTQLGIRSPWTKLGDAHFASERLRQIADLTGVYGVSAVVALANAAAAEVIYAASRRRGGRPVDGRRLLSAVLGVAIVSSAALLYGEARRQSAGTAEPALDVVVVQGNLSPTLRWKRSAASTFLRRYAALTREALSQGDAELPALVVWPENAVQTTLDDPVYGPPLRALAGRGVPMLIGAPRVERVEGGSRHYNSALLLRPDGEAEHYDKRHLLLFSETRSLGGLADLSARDDLAGGQYTPGERLGLFGVDSATLGVMICVEALYPEIAREEARAGASLLVNLSNDGWYRGRGGAEQHLAQVVFRAVETRLPLARAASTGISAIVAPDGEIVASLGVGESGFLRMDLAAPRAGSTFYTRFGDLFAALCVGACLLAAFLPKRRRNAPR